jgi:hypothetical protein
LVPLSASIVSRPGHLRQRGNQARPVAEDLAVC